MYSCPPMRLSASNYSPPPSNMDQGNNFVINFDVLCWHKVLEELLPCRLTNFILAHAHMYVYFDVWAGSSSSTVIPWKNIWQTWRTSHVAAEQKLKSLASSNDGYACICACVLFDWMQREDVWTQSCGMPVLDLWFHYLQWLALLCTFPKATQSRWTLLLLSLLLLHQILCYKKLGFVSLPSTLVFVAGSGVPSMTS